MDKLRLQLPKFSTYLQAAVLPPRTSRYAIGFFMLISDGFRMVLLIWQEFTKTFRGKTLT